MFVLLDEESNYVFEFAHKNVNRIHILQRERERHKIETRRNNRVYLKSFLKQEEKYVIVLLLL